MIEEQTVVLVASTVGLAFLLAIGQAAAYVRVLRRRVEKLESILGYRWDESVRRHRKDLP